MPNLPKRQTLRQHFPPPQPPGDYDRKLALPGLLPLWPSELDILTRDDHAKLLIKLRRALRAERARARAGHWTYDLTRHANLLLAYRSEQRLFAQAYRATPGSRQP